jgi:glutamate carboxypeptidase
MKGGVLFIVWVLRYLAELGTQHAHVEALLTPNEEVGSPVVRPIIEDAARKADAVLVLEPTNLEGSLKLARKGSGEYIVTIHGRSAHQGVAPESGVNAVVEAGHQVLRLLELQDPELGTTVGPNVIRGGTMSNVVPDRAEVRVDVRAWTSAEVARLEHDLLRLQPQVAGAQIEVTGGWNRPPMETTPTSIDLYEHVRAIGRGLGLDLGWVRWGGSSDANLTAAVGTPTIDGFGPVGDGAHQLDECIVIDRVPERLALLAEVLRSLGSMKLPRP